MDRLVEGAARLDKAAPHRLLPLGQPSPVAVGGVGLTGSGWVGEDAVQHSDGLSDLDEISVWVT
jgi:hypothetical protein